MPVLGASFSNKSKRLNFGLQIRPILRYSYDGTNQISTYGDAATITEEITNNSNEDSAVAYDMGFLWTLADFWYPTLGIAVFNIPSGCKTDYLNPYDQTAQEICGTYFQSDSTVDKNALANLDPTDIRLGVSISPRLARKMAIRMARASGNGQMATFMKASMLTGSRQARGFFSASSKAGNMRGSG